VADTKISDLDAITTLDGTEEFVVADGGTTKKIAASDLSTELGGGGAMALIEEVVLGADTASFDFQSIPGTYSHLLIVGILRSTQSAIQSEVRMRLNNDSGGNYNTQLQYALGGGSIAVQSASQSQTYLACALTSGGTATSGNAGVFRALIPVYAGTTFRKSVRVEGEYSRDDGGNDPISTNGGGTWKSTAAVTRVTVFPESNNWLAGCQLSLYGLE
jgi:hypothetical protein